MYCLVLLIFLLQYLTNAENLGSVVLTVTSKPTLIIPNNFILNRIKVERRIFHKILYEVDSSDIP
jgi:hypothetical protein